MTKSLLPAGIINTMAYEPGGLRVRLEESTGVKQFVWDDQNYLQQTDASGATQVDYTTEPSTYGPLISHRKSGATATYHYDALGSTSALTDASQVGAAVGTVFKSTSSLWSVQRPLLSLKSHVDAINADNEAAAAVPASETSEAHATVPEK
ncbi:MAG: hypothetical protein R3C01_09740 [Planctomycetaceae bacterium]